MNSIEDPKIAAERLMQRAYNSDGLPELTVGLIWLFFAGLMYATAVFPKGSPAFTASVLGFAFGCPLLGWTTPRFVKWVRGRYLTGRFGYVRPKRRERKVLWRGMLIGIGFACVLVGGSLLFKKWDKWVLLVAASCAGAGQIGFGRWMGVPRFLVTGLFCALSGTALSLTDLPLDIAFSAWFGAIGLVEILCGGVVLLRFLAKSPATEGSGGN
jgi:hypothetical protein